ncbi:unnamed protein product, partial [Protopolystoma xenopodis]
LPFYSCPEPGYPELTYPARLGCPSPVVATPLFSNPLFSVAAFDHSLLHPDCSTKAGPNMQCLHLRKPQGPEFGNDVSLRDTYGASEPLESMESINTVEKGMILTDYRRHVVMLL